MDISRLVEALLAGLVLSDAAGEAEEDLAILHAQAESTDAPLQWLLITCGSKQVCALLRQAGQAFLQLAEAIETGHERGAQDGCGLWYALASAPSWLLRPRCPDDTLPDVALIRLRDDLYDGDWEALIVSMEEANREGWQWAISRCRALERIERELGRSLADLLRPQRDDASFA